MWYVICNMTYHFIEWHFISLKCNQTTKILLNSKSTFKVSLKKKELPMLQVPRKEMVFDEHVPHALSQRPLILVGGRW